MEQKEEKSELEKKQEQREQLIAQRKKSFYKSLKKSEEEEKKPSRKKSDGKKEKLEKKKRDRKDTLDDIRDDLLSARYILIKDLKYMSPTIKFYSLSKPEKCLSSVSEHIVFPCSRSKVQSRSFQNDTQPQLSLIIFDDCEAPGAADQYRA